MIWFPAATKRKRKGFSHAEHIIVTVTLAYESQLKYVHFTCATEQHWNCVEVKANVIPLLKAFLQCYCLVHWCTVIRLKY